MLPLAASVFLLAALHGFVYGSSKACVCKVQAALNADRHHDSCEIQAFRSLAHARNWYQFSEPYRREGLQLNHIAHVRILERHHMN